MTQPAAARIALATAVLMAAGGCAVTDKMFGGEPAVKPAELVAFKPTANVKISWRANVGGAEKYVFSPALDVDAVYATGAGGQIVRFDVAGGKQLARIDSKNHLSGGVGSDGQLVLVGTARGEVLAFEPNGKLVWKTQLTSEVLSAPQIDQGMVVVRSGDGRIYGLDATTGVRKWVYQRTLPALTVRTHVGAVLHRGGVFAGFPGGRLVAISLATGNVVWEATVAVPKGATELERVADISSPPVIDSRQVCAVAFQGRVACFEILKGTLNWGRDISSIAGMAVDDRNVYVADDKSAVLAFDKSSGASVWKQDKLYGRNVSGPAVVGNYVALGDFEGYVHFLARDDGSFVARVATDGSAIIARPLALDNGVLVQTRNGGVFTIAVQ